MYNKGAAHPWQAEIGAGEERKRPDMFHRTPAAAHHGPRHQTQIDEKAEKRMDPGS